MELKMHRIKQYDLATDDNAVVIFIFKSLVPMPLSSFAHAGQSLPLNGIVFQGDGEDMLLSGVLDSAAISNANTLTVALVDDVGIIVEEKEFTITALWNPCLSSKIPRFDIKLLARGDCEVT